MKKKSIIPKAEKIKTPEDELLVLSELSMNETYMTVLKRAVRRYAELLRNRSFRLTPEHPHFAITHTRYYEQANGMQILIDLIEKSPNELAKREKEEG